MVNDLVREALEQALCCILGDTPEDMSREEARDDTVEKINAAFAALSAPPPAQDWKYQRLAEAVRLWCGREGVTDKERISVLANHPLVTVAPPPARDERDAHVKNTAWNDGRRAGIKWAVSFLHGRASEMNDHGARAALNVAANDLGTEAKSFPPHARDGLREALEKWSEDRIPRDEPERALLSLVVSSLPAALASAQSGEDRLAEAREAFLEAVADNTLDLEESDGEGYWINLGIEARTAARLMSALGIKVGYEETLGMALERAAAAPAPQGEKP